MVRIVPFDAAGFVQIDVDGSANGGKWATIARLDGLPAGSTVGVIVDPTLPAKLLTVSDSETINNADGTHVIHRYDGMDQQAFSESYEYYDNQWRLTQQVSTYDDSHVDGRWDVSNQFVWSCFEVISDSQWRPLNQMSHYDDGTTWLV